MGVLTLVSRLCGCTGEDMMCRWSWDGDVVVVLHPNIQRHNMKGTNMWHCMLIKEFKTRFNHVAL